MSALLLTMTDMTLLRRLSPALALTLLLTLVGCTPEPDPEPEPVANAFAADLTDGAFDGGAVTDSSLAAEQLSSILGDLAEFPRTVSVAWVSEVDETPDQRLVGLDWSIDLGEGVEPLTMSTSTILTLAEGEWSATWVPAVVHSQASADSVMTIKRSLGERADVTGWGGQPLVVDRDVFRIGIDKANLPQDRWQVATEGLAAALELDDPAGYVQRVLDAGPAAYPVALTIRQTDGGKYGVELLRGMEGVLIQADTLPLAPTPGFARPILGNVGAATAEIVAASEGMIQASDVVGTSGLQFAYDAQLRGAPAITVMMTGTSGEVVLSESAPVRGTDLALTLDSALQEYAELRLADVPSASAIVMLQASTGSVLAAASGPGGAGMSTATVGQYAPGSTFKIATALALLRSGLTPESPVECTPTVTVNGREFENYPGYPSASVGTIPLREAIAQSCNTALIAQHESVSAADIANAAASLGIGAVMPEGEKWPFAYYSGVVPTDATGTAHAASLIGQGGVLASPLAMAGVAASVGAGRTVTPTLVSVETPPVPVAPAIPLTGEEAGALQSLMFGVVETGTSSFLQQVPGGQVGAKSGTAQFGTTDPPQTHAWMIAFQGDLAVAVLVEVGDYGTATAGPILQDVLNFAASSGWEARG